jgi:hypothetical protein
MNSRAKTTKQFKNIESPFTELFLLLKVGRDPEAHKAIYQHSSNAMELLMHGLQALGQLLGASSNIFSTTDLPPIGFLISALGNLTEALNTLRSDIDFMLKQRMNSEYTPS